LRTSRLQTVIDAAFLLLTLMKDVRQGLYSASGFGSIILPTSTIELDEHSLTQASNLFSITTLITRRLCQIPCLIPSD
jgi:hypothetical protein